jgi:hypothetical protein
MAGSASVFSAWYVEPAGESFDTSSERWAFKASSTLGKTGVILDSENTLGTRTRRVENTRLGPYNVTGTLVIDVTPLWLDKWLPRILGANESTDTFATAETVQAFDIMQDLEGGVFTHLGCKVNKATFRGRQGGIVECTLDIVGKTETTGASPPAVALGTAAGDYPYVFTDAAVSLYASSRAIQDFEFSIDNQIKASFYNSLTASELIETGRIVMLNSRTKFTSTEMSALYDQGVAGAAATITCTNGGMSWVTTFGRFQPPVARPVVDAGEYLLPLSGQCRGIAGGADISMTNDPVA